MTMGVDYAKHTETELVQMFGRLDPRYAPAECARLGEYLTGLGYVVTQGSTGPGSAVPGAAKLQAIMGSSSPIECSVSFGLNAGLFRRFEPSHNDFNLVGAGILEANGVEVILTGRLAGALPGLLGSFAVRSIQLLWQNVVNVERADNVVYLAHHPQGSSTRGITLWFADAAGAERVVAALPKGRTADFRPQLAGHIHFERGLIAQSPRTPVTVGLVAVNTLVFLGMVAGGAAFFSPNGAVQIAWGSNFGPYTTDGDWWRLLTSLFIHFGVLHLVLNMWALAIFGPLVERLYGSANYLFIYLASGLIGGLVSLSWHPFVNAAGASGAILGIMGALLAAQLRAGETFPSNIVRPLRSTTLMFLAWTLYTGFASTGVDNAAHLGGLASGFTIGLAGARPVTGGKSYSARDMLRLLQMALIVTIMLVAGAWTAVRASAKMTGDALFLRTERWVQVGERTANTEYHAALIQWKGNKSDRLAFADRIEIDVLPFWREASDRLAAIRLESASPYVPRLKNLQTLSNERVDALELYAAGLRRNDQKEVARAQAELREIKALITQKNPH
jgi:rhomboid protease GluP